MLLVQVLRGDLIDAARPGEEIEVTGIYLHQFDPSLNSRQVRSTATAPAHAC